MTIRTNLTGRHEGGRVLITDDEPFNRLLLRDLLTMQGFETMEAGSGAAAVEMAGKLFPDAILMDVMMPGMTGFEACRLLKSNPATKHIPVLMITALVDRDSRLEGIEAGANDFITKPVDVRDIPLRVRNAVASKKIHDELQLNLTRMAELEKARDNLSNMIVHDMRSPLLGISGHLELLKMFGSEGVPAEHMEFIDGALDSTRKLVQMVNSILDIRRLEDEKMPLEIGPHCLRGIVWEAVRTLGHLIGHAKVTVQQQDPLELFCACDRAIMRRVLANLISNSLKSMPAQEGKVMITIDPMKTGLQLTVSDNGRGIAQEDLGRVFELFGQGGNRDGYRDHSSGMGLTFCKLAVESHGGRIRLDSVVDSGTTVVLELPIWADENEAGRIPPAVETPPANSALAYADDAVLM